MSKLRSNSAMADTMCKSSLPLGSSRDEVDPQGGEFVERRDHVPQTSEKPVGFVDEYQVEFSAPSVGQHSVEGRATILGTRDSLILEVLDETPSSVLDEAGRLVVLERGILIVAGDAEISRDPKVCIPVLRASEPTINGAVPKSSADAASATA
jgi:hypothetical protein